MLRRALLLAVALAGALGCTDAWAARTTLTVGGEIHAIAFAGEAMIVVRQPVHGNHRLERLTAATRAQTLLHLPRSRDETPVSLAASAQALALSFHTNEDSGASHVFVGTPAGPLREVAACQAGLVLPAVAVSGSRIAWASGGCGQPAREPVSASQATIVIGGADPATPARLIALGPEVLPTALVLNGDTGLAGLIRPSFFSFFKSEVRRLGVSQLGETTTREDAGVVLAVGVLRNGETVYSLSRGDDDGDNDGAGDQCDRSLFALAPGATQRRALSLGGCPTEEDFALPVGGARTAGERVYAIVEQDRANNERDAEQPPPTALRSVRGDGGGEQLLARGVYRAPLGLATDGSGRVAWWQRACTGGSEIVIDDGLAPASPAAIPSCTVKVLNRSARVRGRRVTLRLRCPSGCSGQVFNKGEFVRSFTFERGTHRLRLRLTRRERRAKRLRLRFEVDDGPRPKRAVVIRLR